MFPLFYIKKNFIIHFPFSCEALHSPHRQDRFTCDKFKSADRPASLPMCLTCTCLTVKKTELSSAFQYYPPVSFKGIFIQLNNGWTTDRPLMIVQYCNTCFHQYSLEFFQVKISFPTTKVSNILSGKETLPYVASVVNHSFLVFSYKKLQHKIFFSVGSLRNWCVILL